MADDKEIDATLESEVELLAEFARSKKQKVAFKKKKSAAEGFSRVPPSVPANKKKSRESKSVPAPDPGIFSPLNSELLLIKISGLLCVIDLLLMKGSFTWVSLRRLDLLSL